MGQLPGHQDLKRSDREMAMLLERIRDNADGFDEVRSLCSLPPDVGTHSGNPLPSLP
jgi:hypothetical protein